MKRNLFCAFIVLIWSNIFWAQESPFGTGAVNDVSIGTLDDPGVEFVSNTGWGSFEFFPGANELLASYEFDLYIPPSYDGSEPYGLVTWINAGNNGTPIASWKDVLDEKKLIWVGGNDIGNSVYIHIRMGVAWAAVLRMKELFNIDEDRIYTSGKSGGARMANTLAYIYPEWIDATLPLCGASFPLEVDQDYETHEPDSHYEVILPLTPSDVDYIKTFDQRYGIMTSYGDFREGDIMNIYHHGLEANGFESRFLEKTGGHCATSTVHFRDAVNFVEHNFIPIVDYESGLGADLVLTNVSDESGLLLNGDSGDLAQLKTSNLFSWNEDKGSIVRLSFSLDDGLASPENTVLDISLVDYDDGAHFCTYEGNILDEAISAIRVRTDFSSGEPVVSLEVENSADGEATLLLFNGVVSDWSSTADFNIKLHAWNNELRVDFSHHFQEGWTTAAGTKLLDDKRSLRIRWAEITGSPFWTTEQWQNGTFLTIGASKSDAAMAGGNCFVNTLNIQSDLPDEVHTFGELTIEESGANLIAVEADLTDYQWYKDGEAIDGAVTNTLADFIIYGDGIFTLAATHTDGCSVTSNELEYDYSGIAAFAQNIGYVYPNPFKTILFIPGVKSQDVKLYDPLGNNLKDQIKFYDTSEGCQLNGEQLSSGIYFIVVNNKTISLVKK